LQQGKADVFAAKGRRIEKTTVVVSEANLHTGGSK
jgi:hypothetical protein